VDGTASDEVSEGSVSVSASALVPESVTEELSVLVVSVSCKLVSLPFIMQPCETTTAARQRDSETAFRYMLGFINSNPMVLIID
jgi:hypothetical protein